MGMIKDQGFSTSKKSSNKEGKDSEDSSEAKEESAK